MSDSDDVVIAEGDRVTFVDQSGETYDAVVIDVFESGPSYEYPYANLVYNPERADFYANVVDDLTDATSVLHRSDGNGSGYYYELGWHTEGA